jgi:hypothetical protein
MEQGSEDDDHFSVFAAQVMIGNGVGRDPVFSKQSQQFQGDIGDDLNVDWPMIAHSQPLDSVDIDYLPQGIDLNIRINPIYHLLQSRIVPGRNSDHDSLWRLRDFWRIRNRHPLGGSQGGYFIPFGLVFIPHFMLLAPRFISFRSLRRGNLISFYNHYTPIYIWIVQK